MKKIFPVCLLLFTLLLVFASCEKPDEKDNKTSGHTHEFGEWVIVKYSTESEAGLKERTCSCGEKEKKILSKGSAGLEYALNEDGKSYSVVGIGTCGDTNAVIPSSYNDLPVTSLSEYALCGWEGLQSVILPDTLVIIGDSAFSMCEQLTDIIIPESVTTIAERAFWNCVNLTYIFIPDSVTSIGWGAFYFCRGLTSIVIPNSVTYIGENAFFSCTHITIYCEAESQPSGWDSSWNPDYRPVVWGYEA